MPGLPFNDNLGETIPPDTPHAVSVSLPTWSANVGYEEGERWVLDKMQCGYPRFFIHKIIDKLADAIVTRHGSLEREKALLLPSMKCAKRCILFFQQQDPKIDASQFRILHLVPRSDKTHHETTQYVQPQVWAVIYEKQLWPLAKAFWQHSGEGISSRRGEFCLRAFEDGSLVESSTVSASPRRLAKGPRRYQRATSGDLTNGSQTAGNANGLESQVDKLGVRDSALFVEERFGRNLDVGFASQAKLAIRRRIAGSLTNDHELPNSLEEPSDLSRVRSHDVPNFSVEDVYLYPCGMNAIFHAHQTLQTAIKEEKSVMYGFPYVDTLKVLEKFGPGAVFYGDGNAADLDDLERRLESGEQILSLFCEFPGNPLLKTPDVRRIRALADKYDFAVVIDETIGNFLNVHVLPYADVLVSSLTKIFSGDSNVMGGSMILNPNTKFYHKIKQCLDEQYEDNQFEEDSIYLERNSRDFIARIQRVNHNAEAIAGILQANPRVKQVNYPKYSDTRPFYDACRLPDGGYGGLLSATFHRLEDAQVFYDHLNTHKGPSLGTNFTLGSPFVLLAHYGELDWAAQYGCEISLVRFSVGLEDTTALEATFKNALAAIPEAGHSSNA